MSGCGPGCFCPADLCEPHLHRAANATGSMLPLDPLGRTCEPHRHVDHTGDYVEVPMTARERLLALVAREVETAALEGHPTGVKYLAATLDEVRELLDAIEAEARRPLEEALEEVSKDALDLAEAILSKDRQSPEVAFLLGRIHEKRAALAQREPAS